MNNQDTLIFIICFSLAAILLIKYFKIKKEIKIKEKHICTCTDTTLRTAYHGNERLYYYKYIFNKEEYTTSDKTKFKLPYFSPTIGEELELYIDPKDPNKIVTPIQYYYSKLFLFLGIVLIILPFLLTI